MLSERNYMKRAQQKPMSPTVLLIAILAGAYLLQVVGEGSGFDAEIAQYVALSKYAVASGRFWTFLTAAFLHGSIGHLACNCIGLYFVGRIVEQMTRPSRYWIIFLGSALLGNILWYVLEPATLHIVEDGVTLYRGINPSTLVGASGGVFGIMSYFFLKTWDRPITMALYFVLPIQAKSRTFFWVLLVGQIALNYMPGGSSYGNIAYMAHVGGMIFPIFFCLFVEHDRLIQRIFLPFLTKRSKAQDFTYHVNIDNKEDENISYTSVDVDRILEKIEKTGANSLTEHERQILLKESKRIKKE